MADRVHFAIKGLRELDRALGKADKNLRKNLRNEFREVASIVAVKARAFAESKGLRESGDLIAGIRPFATGRAVGVRAGAVHRGFAYPSRMEYEDRGGGSYGPRAFLNPAVEVSEGQVARGIGGVLRSVVSCRSRT